MSVVFREQCDDLCGWSRIRQGKVVGLIAGHKKRQKAEEGQNHGAPCFTDQSYFQGSHPQNPWCLLPHSCLHAGGGKQSFSTVDSTPTNSVGAIHGPDAKRGPRKCKIGATGHSFWAHWTADQALPTPPPYDGQS